MSAAEWAERLRVPAGLLERAGWRDATDAEVRKTLGYHSDRGADLAGVLVPYRHPRTGDALGHRAWLRQTTGDRKYIRTPGLRWRYLPPVQAAWLDDATAPVVVLESERSTLALLALAERAGRPMVPLALGGCWGWREKVTREPQPDGTLSDVTGPTPSLEWLEWSGREAIIMLDGDAGSESSVAAARRGLAHELAGRGAQVRIADVPLIAGPHTGPDDVLEKSGDDALFRLLDAARPWPECALADAESAIAALEALDPKAKHAADPLLAIAAVAAVDDPVKRAIYIARMKGCALTKPQIEKRVGEIRAHAVAARTAAAAAARRGRLLNMPVDGAALLCDIAAFIRRFVRQSEPQLNAVVLTVVNSHVFRAAMYCPVVHVTAPEKECGKSRLLEVMRLFVWQPWMTGRTTAANLQAKCAEGCTLLLDEADAAMEQEREYVAALRGILDCRFEANKPASIRVPNPEGGWMSQDLDVYGPTFIAGIGRLPDTVTSRAIVVRLQRQPRTERTEKFRPRKVRAEAAALRERLEAWCAQHIERLREADPEMPAGLRDRQEDIAEPLLAIADAAGGEWPGWARRALVEVLTGAAVEDDSLGVRLLADIRAIMAGRDRIASAELAAALGAMEDRPWAEWGRTAKPITQPAVARLLARYRGPAGVTIAPRTIRIGTDTLKGYLTVEFAEVWGAYLPADTSPTVQPDADSTSPNRNTATDRINTERNGSFAAATAAPCGGDENAGSSNNDAGCVGVSAANRQNGHAQAPPGLFDLKPEQPLEGEL